MRLPGPNTTKVSDMRDDRHTIWVIEDDEVLAEVTSFRLELLGYDVEMFFHGEKVMKIVEKRRESEGGPAPNLIILDVAVGDTDGFELIHRLKADPLTAESPIMVFSSDGDLNSVQRCYSAGAHEFLVTPFDPAVLEAKIERLIETAAV